MKVSSDLLDALQMTRVRDAEEYEAMRRRRTSASGYGSIHYRLREPRRFQELPGEALSTYGNAVVGGLQLPPTSPTVSARRSPSRRRIRTPCAS